MTAEFPGTPEEARCYLDDVRTRQGYDLVRRMKGTGAADTWLVERAAQTSPVARRERLARLERLAAGIPDDIPDLDAIGGDQ